MPNFYYASNYVNSGSFDNSEAIKRFEDTVEGYEESIVICPLPDLVGEISGDLNDFCPLPLDLASIICSFGLPHEGDKYPTGIIVRNEEFLFYPTAPLSGDPIRFPFSADGVNALRTLYIHYKRTALTKWISEWEDGLKPQWISHEWIMRCKDSESFLSDVFDSKIEALCDNLPNNKNLVITIETQTNDKRISDLLSEWKAHLKEVPNICDDGSRYMPINFANTAMAPEQSKEEISETQCEEENDMWTINFKSRGQKLFVGRMNGEAFVGTNRHKQFFSVNIIVNSDQTVASSFLLGILGDRWLGSREKDFVRFTIPNNNPKLKEELRRALRKLGVTTYSITER